MKPFFVTARAIEIYVASDGQKFTDLIRKWANVYLRQHGASAFSINGVAWRTDGGVDGIINDPALFDPFGWIPPRSVMQFKAGPTSVAKAKKEILARPKPGEVRIRDKIADGFRLVWFVGKGLPDTELTAFEDNLDEFVNTVKADSPRPIVVDANRLADLLSRTPAVALELSNNPGLFLTTDRALGQNPHDKLKKFVPGSNFEAFRKDVVDFFLDVTNSEQIKYVAGEPGIGKTRYILEAIESSNELKGTVCYFVDPGRVAEFFILAKQEQWCGCLVIDEYIGESRTTVEVSDKTVPSGMKILLIGHAYETNRLSREVSNRLAPPSKDEIRNALSETYTALPAFRIQEAVLMSRQNIRLARLVCDYFSKNPSAQQLDANSLERIVVKELQRMPNGQDVLKRLALLPNLLGEETSEFCELLGIDERDFRKACREISQSSALIQYNDHVAYIGSPAVAQLALMKFWNDEKEFAELILARPGKFAERFLVAINQLPVCHEKEAMLKFFFLPLSNLKLTDLLDVPNGPRFLSLLVADPDTHLPVLRRLVTEAQGRLNNIPYEGTRIGRRDIIWRVRDLAQFGEYFEDAEQIVYAFAREEVKSAYADNASSYWQSWFQAYFDYTVYPFEKRLDLLERRALEGDALDRQLVLRAVADPFPDVGDSIPSQRVGGRLAPPELNFIHHKQIRLAAERMPPIYKVLLSTATAAFQAEVADTVIKQCYTWLERGVLEPYLAMVTDTSFPKDARQRLTAKVRHYIEIARDRAIESDDHVTAMGELHEQLLERIDEPDPFIAVLEISEHDFWRGVGPGTEPNRKLEQLASECSRDEEFLFKTIDFLSNPTNDGGGSFGMLLGSRISDQTIEYILGHVSVTGFSQFTYTAIVAAANSKPERKGALLDFAKSWEQDQPQAALSIYQMFGNETYFEEATRLLDSTPISCRYFRAVFLGTAAELNESHWGYVEAIARRTGDDDEYARECLASSVEQFAHHEVEDERAYALGLAVLKQSSSDSMRTSGCEWSDIALWAYKRYPAEVVAIAAQRKQSEFSMATATLAEIAKSDPQSVLNALTPKLANPYQAPFLLIGGISKVVQVLPVEVFNRWMQRQELIVIETMAGHLPKPLLDNGKAIVPDLTRAYWGYCMPQMGETYERALSNFGALNYNTGAFWGHGIELFSARIELGRQLLNDGNPGIRAWAEDFVKQSEQLLADALRERDLHDAMRDTSE